MDLPYLIRMESFVYFAMSLFDAFELAQAPVPYFVDMFKLIFSVPPDAVLAQTALLFIKEGAQQLAFQPEMVGQVLCYVQFVLANFAGLQGLACKTVAEVAESCPQHFSEPILGQLQQLVRQGCPALKPESVGVLSKAFGIVVLHMKDEQVP